MKKLIFNLFLATILTTSLFAQNEPYSIGDRVEHLEFELIDDRPIQVDDIQFKDKVLILEFWATWCSPCITAMDHLAKLKKEFGDKILVVAVSVENNHDRINNFLQNRSYDFTFAIDEDDKLRNLFPSRIIPHTVIIDKKMEVAAITAPENIQSTHIDALLKGETIDLPLKLDNIDFDYSADYFNAPADTERTFVIQPAIPGVSTFIKAPSTGPFANRRISVHNQTIDGLYREAFNISSYRLDYEVDESLFDYEVEENKYCLDIIVAPNETENLHNIFQQKLKESFAIQGRLETKEKEVVILTKVPGATSNLSSSSTKGNISSRGDQFKSSGATFKDFTDFLEGYGIVRLPVVDETGDNSLYKFDFSFQPEDSDTFFKALEGMGVKVKKVKRNIDVLVIHDQKGN